MTASRADDTGATRSGRPRRASSRTQKTGATPPPIAVMVVDDHPMWRDTLRKVLDDSRVAKVVAEAGDGEEAIRLAVAIRPELIVMDIHLPVLGGAETTREVRRLLPSAKVLVLSASEERGHVLAAVEAGASGYLLKTAKPADVVDAVRRVHQGELVFPAAVAEVVLERLRDDDRGQRARLRVVLADGSRLFRDGLAKMLEEVADIDVLARVGNADQLLDSVKAADVVVLDVRLPGSRGASRGPIISQLRAERPEVAVLVLSQDLDPDAASLLVAGAAGGIGYLLKERVSDIEQLADAIRRIAQGGSVLDPTVAEQLVHPAKTRDVLDELTERERDVLALMAEGRSNQAIADGLFMSAKAVEAHTRNIFMKLGLEPAPDDHRRVLAVITYLRSG